MLRCTGVDEEGKWRVCGKVPQAPSVPCAFRKLLLRCWPLLGARIYVEGESRSAKAGLELNLSIPVVGAEDLFERLKHLYQSYVGKPFKHGCSFYTKDNAIQFLEGCNNTVVRAGDATRQRGFPKYREPARQSQLTIVGKESQCVDSDEPRGYLVNL